MTQHIENSGFANFGTANISGSAFGPHAVVTNHGPGQREAERPRAGIGVVTILAEEAAAVRDVLGLRPDPDGTPDSDVGTVRSAGRQVVVAAVRALAPGEGAAVSAVNRLRARYRPAAIILAGIGGGIHPAVRTGDVVTATRVICYDARKETPAGVVRRGIEFQAPALAGHAAGQFFTAHGDPALLNGPDSRPFRVHYGPIGSGNAVIADQASQIRAWLRHYNDKILAIDMEASGFAMACHDDPDGPPPPWLIIRGISDDASAAKNDDHHQAAAIHAALALREIIPHLPLPPDRSAAR